MPYGLLELPPALQSKPQVVMCIRIVRPDSQGLEIMPHGLLELPLFRQSKSLIVMCFRILGLDLQGFVKVGNGFVDVSPVGNDEREVVVRSCLLGRFRYTIPP